MGEVGDLHYYTAFVRQYWKGYTVIDRQQIDIEIASSLIFPSTQSLLPEVQISQSAISNDDFGRRQLTALQFQIP